MIDYIFPEFSTFVSSRTRTWTVWYMPTFRQPFKFTPSQYSMFLFSFSNGFIVVVHPDNDMNKSIVVGCAVK